MIRFFIVLCVSLGCVMANTLGKRDYAAALAYLKAAMATYQQDGPPPAELVYLEQKLSPPPPPTMQPVWQDPTMMMDPTMMQEPYFDPTLPPMDIEEDDTFDPEEDPDDVDDPPIINGKPVEREE